MFPTKIRQVFIEDLQVALEDWFGKTGETVPASIKNMVRKGEKGNNLRIKMFKLANKALWEAMDNYLTELLCDDDEDVRRWNKAIKEAREE